MRVSAYIYALKLQSHANNHRRCHTKKKNQIRYPKSGKIKYKFIIHIGKLLQNENDRGTHTHDKPFIPYHDMIFSIHLHLTTSQSKENKKI